MRSDRDRDVAGKETLVGAYKFSLIDKNDLSEPFRIFLHQAMFSVICCNLNRDKIECIMKHFPEWSTGTPFNIFVGPGPKQNIPVDAIL